MILPEKLTQEEKQLMLEELNYSSSYPSSIYKIEYILYHNYEEFKKFIIEAINDDDPAKLLLSDLFDSERYKQDNNEAPINFAEDVFSRYYIRAICRKAKNENKKLIIYVEKENKPQIHKVLEDPNWTLEQLFKNDLSTNKALGLNDDFYLDFWVEVEK